MKESFERKPKNLETEASSYEIETTFSPAELKREAEASARTTYKRFPLSYAISDDYKFYLSLTGHWSIVKQFVDRSGLRGGTLQVNDKLNILEIGGFNGLSIRNVDSEDFPLIKKIAQRYLDKIKK